jgi:hypothetical protein
MEMSGSVAVARATDGAGTTGKDIGIVTVGTCSTIDTLLPFKFLELDALLILFYYAYRKTIPKMKKATTNKKNDIYAVCFTDCELKYVINNIAIQKRRYETQKKYNVKSCIVGFFFGTK